MKKFKKDTSYVLSHNNTAGACVSVGGTIAAGFDGGSGGLGLAADVEGNFGSGTAGVHELFTW